ncbi:hypothetical protein EYF80_011742 [Liparis tanakae]|uniref:Uncharacterized protein n=1 Tax=Liparis tanakae TaxID=230148 RepID=A0A4Z2IJ35_9TELE|nr:hypothetical protein EYF80_011742 [Liparis tanakae]
MLRTAFSQTQRTLTSVSILQSTTLNSPAFDYAVVFPYSPDGFGLTYHVLDDSIDCTGVGTGGGQQVVEEEEEGATGPVQHGKEEEGEMSTASTLRRRRGGERERLVH